MPLVPYALTSVEAVEAVLGEGTFASERVAQIINASTDRIEHHCSGRRFATGSHTQNLAGNGRWLLRLKHWPILSVESVEVNGQAVTDFELTDEAEQGLLYRSLTWPANLAAYPDLTGDMDPNSARPNITVEYTAGYVLSGEDRTLPYDLEQACIDLVVRRLMQPTPGLTSERTAGGHATTWSDRDLPPEICAALRPYRGSIR